MGLLRSMTARRPPAIIAHRGASRECRENTIPAFARALEHGVDGIELDVHGTRDGVLVVHHDRTLPVRRGEAVEELPIAALSAAEVAAVRLSSGDEVPTLDAVCDLVGGRAALYVEIKAPHVEAMVATCLDRHPGVHTEIHAFDHRIPVGVRAVRPGTPIGLLSASYPLDVRSILSVSEATAFWQQADLIDEALVVAVHEAGARLIAWTVNNAPHARQLATWGVDGLCTDVPDVIRTAVLADRSGADSGA